MTNVISAVLNATFRELKQTLLEGGGGGRAKYKKIYIFAQGKIKWKKIHARQLTLKNIHAMA